MKRISNLQVWMLLCTVLGISCTDIVVVDVYQKALSGPHATVRILIDTEFKNRSAISSRSTAADVNEGSPLNPIHEAVVAAYVETGTTGFDNEDRSFSSLNLGTIDIESTKLITKTMNAPIGKVNFLFYGNGAPGTWSGFSSFAQGAYITDIRFNLENSAEGIPDLPGQYFQRPPALLYWSETSGLEIVEQQAPEQQITLNEVHYGIGNLVTVVKNTTVNEGDLSLLAVFVGNQPKSVDWKFEPINVEASKAIIYDNTMNITDQYLPSTYPSPLTPENINNYTLVFPTPSGEDVPVALAVKSTASVVLNNGTAVPAGTIIYLPPVLIKALSVSSGLNQQVFKSDYKTIARFSVSTLKNGSIEPLPMTKADVVIDLSLSVEWKEGAMIDFEVP